MVSFFSYQPRPRADNESEAADNTSDETPIVHSSKPTNPLIVGVLGFAYCLLMFGVVVFGIPRIAQVLFMGYNDTVASWVFPMLSCLYGIGLWLVFPHHYVREPSKVPIFLMGLGVLYPFASINRRKGFRATAFHLPNMFASVVLIPLSEELLHRRYFYARVLRDELKISRWKSFVINGLFFGLAHSGVENFDFRSFLFALMMGIVYCALFETSPLLSWPMHVANNFYAVWERHLRNSIRITTLSSQSLLWAGIMCAFALFF